MNITFVHGDIPMTDHSLTNKMNITSVQGDSHMANNILIVQHNEYHHCQRQLNNIKHQLDKIMRIEYL